MLFFRMVLPHRRWGGPQLFCSFEMGQSQKSPTIFNPSPSAIHLQKSKKVGLEEPKEQLEAATGEVLTRY